jgi:NAD-dependent dihydropyrimidine dehydrogenase PreA subunit
MVEIKIDYSCCTGCKKCVEVCDYGVLEWFEEQPTVTNPKNCSTCMKCELGCPEKAVSVKK